MNQLLKRIVTGSLFALFFNILAVASTNFQIDTLAVQQAMKKVPASSKKDAASLGKYMANQYADEPSRAYAISYWLASNIDYDFKGLTEQRMEEFSPNIVLQNKKALSGEFAELFKAVCDSAGLQSEIIVGYVKGFDFLPNDTLFRSEHSWSAVKVNNLWQLVDLTHAAGTIVPKEDLSTSTESIYYSLPYLAKAKFVKNFNSKWVFADPAMLVRSHYPIIKDFQLLENPLSFDDFKAGEEAIEKHLNINSDTIANSQEISTYTSKKNAEKLFYLGDYGLQKNNYNRQVKAYFYLKGAELLAQEKMDVQKNSLVGKKAELKKLKKYTYTADSCLKICLTDNEMELRQIQKRSENWKISLKENNKVHRESLKNRIRANNLNLKYITNIYQKGMAITEHLNGKNAQFAEKSLEGVARPKTADPVLEKESKKLMQQQDSLRKLALGVLFEIENINRTYSQEKVTAICETEKEALKIYTACLDNLQSLEKKYKTTLSMVHIPTTNVDKEWLKDELENAAKINQTNIDVLLAKLSENELKLYENIKLYTGFVKERLNLLKLAKKGSTIDQKEDSLYLAAVSNYTDNILSYHYELKTATITKNLLQNNLEDENKKMTQLIERLQKESDVENLRHKTYMEYRKLIKNTENLRTKTAIKKLIKLNTLIDKSLMTAK